MQRLLPPLLVLLLSAAMAIATLALSWPAATWPVRVIGIPAALIGVRLTLRHASLFRTLDTNIVTFDDPEILVTNGAFAWTRNPMYLGFVVVLAGVALLLGSAIAFAGPVVFVLAANHWYIPFEERRMEAVFGADYDDYRANVRRWI